MKFLASLEKQSKLFIVLVGFALIGGIGLIDFVTGYEFAFSVFYVLPVALVTWLTSQRLGLVASLASALVWLCADAATGHSYSNHLIPIWNSLIRLCFFVIISSLLSALRKTAEQEARLARTDHLTGAVNSRFFYDLLQMEIDRFQRYKRPFTLAFCDLDNFKTLNDQFGHPMGDHVLRIVVSSARRHLRKTDVVARLGGDEFAFLLPETSEESARVALTNIQNGLLEEMRQNKWPITFSIGVLTCSVGTHSPDELVRLADELMYSVKRNNKNAIKYSTYTG